MFNHVKKSIPYGRHTLTLETGEIARQAGGAVLVSLDDTVVLVTAVARQDGEGRPGLLPADRRLPGKDLRRGQDPRRLLQARRAAVGEGDADLAPHRPPDPAAVSRTASTTRCRSSRRSCRSIPEIDPDIPAMIGASAALALSGIPFNGPIGAARVGYVDGQYVLNPTKTELATSQLEPRRRRHRSRGADGRVGSERAARGSDAGRRRVRPPAAAGGDRADPRARRGSRQAAVGLAAAGEGRGADRARSPPRPKPTLRDAYQLRSKQARQQRLKEIYAKVDAECVPADASPDYANARSATSCSTSRRRSSATRSWPASRASTAATRAPCARSRIRTGVLPRTHGSALFTRGETQALVVATLGTARDEQIIDALMGEYRDRFMFHYNMPPYATGETGRVGSPKRREIGHGRLAKRALHRRAADRRGVRLLDARRLGDHRVERQLVDGVGVRREPRADGRRRADQGARRGHRDGPHQGRQPLRRADRHPRRRGSPRRHGLQGRRHRPRHHRAADGHQDPGHHQGDHGGRAVAGARRPHAHPRASCRRRCRTRAPRSRSTRRA